MKQLISILCLIVVPCILFAQNKSSSKWSLSPGVEANSVAIIDPSAADSAGASLSISPMLKIMHQSGLGFIAKAHFLAGKTSTDYYMTNLSPFYSLDNKKLAIDISYSHFLIQKNNVIPYTPITNEIYASFTLKTKTISPRLGIDYGFGTDTTNNTSTDAHDINIFAGITHSFEWELASNSSLNFSPNLMVNFGTNRYFSFLQSAKYITHNRHFKNEVRGNGKKSQNSELPNININNLEANADFNFSIGKLSIEPEGSLYFPLTGEDKSISSFWQIGISYQFGK